MSRGFVFVVVLASLVMGQAVASPKIGSGAVNQAPTRGISKLSESQCTNGGGKIVDSIFCLRRMMCSTIKNGTIITECIDDFLPQPK